MTTANDVLQFNFTVTAELEITLRTYSYAGGTNAAGQTITSGGFDPILALFNAAGLLIDQDDDGGSNVPADPTTGSHYDTFLQALLPAGTYTVAVSAFSNFANGPTLADGFEGGGGLNGRTPDFAFDVLGADTATGPGATGAVRVIAFGRQQNADGTFTTGTDFFSRVNFGLDSGVQYTEGSRFNDCLIGSQCGAPPPPPPPRRHHRLRRRLRLRLRLHRRLRLRLRLHHRRRRSRQASIQGRSSAPLAATQARSGA